MIYVLYSDDYELYFGGNYLPEKHVLLETTDRVLAACKAACIPMTLFCDVLCLLRYRELGFQEFPEAADAQLAQAIQQGHDVQAHIHPHWLETELQRHADDTTRYTFDLSRFLLGNHIPEGGAALRHLCTEIFAQVKSYLETLLAPVDSRYRCVAFRAGGYGIQPNDREILAALEDTGYLIDSSVVPGMVLETNVNRIDFRAVPHEGNYLINKQQGLARVANSGIYEIPVLALRESEARWLLTKHLFLKILSRFTERAGEIRRGYTIQATDSDVSMQTIPGRIIQHLKTVRRGWLMLELSANPGIMAEAARRYIDHYYKHDGGTLYFSVSCHSKSINERRLSSLASFHHRLKKLYAEELQAITFREAANHITSNPRSVS